MSNTPIGNSLQSSLAIHGATAQRPVSEGQWRGEGVRLHANVASVAEEISFMRAETRSRELAGRKIGRSAETKSEAQEQARSYLHRVRGIDEAQQLKPLLDWLISQAEVSKSGVRSHLGQQFGDISQQYLALAYVRDELHRRRKSAGAASALDSLAATVNDTLDELMMAHGADIRAGINVSEVAYAESEAKASRRLGTLNSLRQFYRDAVLDYGGLGETFRKIVAEHGDQRLSESITYLVLALGADLSAEGPSLPKERLAMIVEDLYKLQSLGSLDHECRKFLEQLERIFRPRAVPKKVRLMEELLALIEKRWLSFEQVHNVPKALNISSKMAIYFWQGFKEIVRMLPTRIYNDPFEREKVLSAIQECLDAAIEDEG